MADQKSKILIIGGTGYIGKFVVEASVKAGNPTFALVRETTVNDPIKGKLVQKFKDSGVNLIHGDLYDHEGLVRAIKQVDVVISTVGHMQLADQVKIIAAIKEAGNIKKCHIHSLAQGTGSITAQRRESPSEETGFVFLGCTISGVRTALLGRPWGSYSRVIFAFTYMSSAILPQGWDDWGDSSTHSTVFYGQYKCYGPGAVMSKRIHYARNLTSLEAEPFLTKDSIDGKAWIRPVPTSFRTAFKAKSNSVGGKN